MNDLLSYLTDRRDEMLQTLRDLVENESPTRDKPANDRIGARIAGLFEQLTGGKATMIPNEIYGNHYRTEWGEGERQILLLAHFDTVWKKGDWKREPLWDVEGDQAYGPGVFDMKGGLVQGLYAVHALSALGKIRNHRIVFLLTSDEEIGSPSSRRLIEDEAGRSRCVLVLEPALSGSNGVKTGRKGVGMFQLTVHGKAVHAGVEPEKGRSAIEELARQIQYLHGLTDYALGTTVNVGVISGGTGTNVIAARAEAGIDLRVTSQAEADRVIPLILGLRPQTEGTRLEVAGGLNRPPMERTEKVAALYETVKSIAKEKLGIELAEGSTGGGSDANFTAPLAPTIDGLGCIGAGAHAQDEHLVISQMPVRSALLAHLIEGLDAQA